MYSDNEFLLFSLALCGLNSLLPNYDDCSARHCNHSRDCIDTIDELNKNKTNEKKIIRFNENKHTLDCRRLCKVTICQQINFKSRINQSEGNFYDFIKAKNSGSLARAIEFLVQSTFVLIECGSPTAPLMH